MRVAEDRAVYGRSTKRCPQRGFDEGRHISLLCCRLIPLSPILLYLSIAREAVTVLSLKPVCVWRLHGTHLRDAASNVMPVRRDLFPRVLQLDLYCVPRGRGSISLDQIDSLPCFVNTSLHGPVDPDEQEGVTGVPSLALQISFSGRPFVSRDWTPAVHPVRVCLFVSKHQLKLLFRLLAGLADGIKMSLAPVVAE